MDTSITITDLMEANPMGSLLISPDSSLAANKYTVAVIKAREVVALNHRYVQSRTPETLDRLMTKFDHLLGFLISQFGVIPSSDEVRTVLNNVESIDALNEDELGELGDGIVPIALIRQIIRKHRVMIDPRKLDHWQAFISRYELAILYA
jgi:hypothetical protein